MNALESRIVVALAASVLLAGCIKLDVSTPPLAEASPTASPAEMAPSAPVSAAPSSSVTPSSPAVTSPAPASAAPTASASPSPAASATASATPSPTEEPATPAPSDTPEPTPKPTPSAIAAIELSGTGQKATQAFTVAGGMTTFTMEHDGDSNFGVWLLDSDGQKVELLANEIGDYDGSRGLGLPAGQYVFDVDADGPWSITVNQPRAGAALEPMAVSGKGPSARGPWQLSSGLRRFTIKHSGESNFAVWLLDEQGEKVDLLVNEIGAFDGSKAVGLDAGGLYFLDIEADGDWSVSVE